MEYNHIVTERITLLCEEHGLTVGELAARCRMNKSTIDNIMQGKSRKPRIQTLYKIAGAFHMSVAEFLDRPEN